MGNRNDDPAIEVTSGTKRDDRIYGKTAFPRNVNRMGAGVQLATPTAGSRGEINSRNNKERKKEKDGHGPRLAGWGDSAPQKTEDWRAFLRKPRRSTKKTGLEKGTNGGTGRTRQPITPFGYTTGRPVQARGASEGFALELPTTRKTGAG